MGTSVNSAGRKLPGKIEDFTDGCALNIAGRHLVLKIGRIVQQEFGSFAGLARELKSQNAPRIPRWARLTEGGERQTSHTRTMVSHHFGRSARQLPSWPDIMLILRTCDAVEEHLVEMASLYKESYKESTGEVPFGYDGDYMDVSKIIMPEPVEAPESTERSATDEKVAELARKVAELEAKLQNLEPPEQPPRSHIHLA